MLHVFIVVGVVCFFFFKQKTAYEMRISDWSSDVCSSDLHRAFGYVLCHHRIGADAGAFVDDDRPQYLRARSDDHIVAQRRVALSADAVGWIGSAQRHALVDRDIVADLSRFADNNAQTVTDEQAAPHLPASNEFPTR